MTKDEKSKFAAELKGLEDEFDERKKGTFTGGPGMASTIQHIAVKKLLTLLIRVILAAN